MMRMRSGCRVRYAVVASFWPLPGPFLAVGVRMMSARRYANVHHFRRFLDPHLAAILRDVDDHLLAFDGRRLQQPGQHFAHLSTYEINLSYLIRRQLTAPLLRCSSILSQMQPEK